MSSLRKFRNGESIGPKGLIISKTEVFSLKFKAVVVRLKKKFGLVKDY